MAREIKFRVWSKKHNAYLKISGLHYDDEKIDGIFAVDCVLAGIPNVIFLEPEDVVLEQDTGLKDKNDEKICEGDIVKIVSEPWLDPDFGIVGFDEDRGVYDSYIIVNDKVYWDTGDDFCSLMGRKNYTTEVIGNIHENKELLEGGDGAISE